MSEWTQNKVQGIIQDNELILSSINYFTDKISFV